VLTVKLVKLGGKLIFNKTCNNWLIANNSDDYADSKATICVLAWLRSQKIFGVENRELD